MNNRRRTTKHNIALGAIMALAYVAVISSATLFVLGYLIGGSQ